MYKCKFSFFCFIPTSYSLGWDNSWQKSFFIFPFITIFVVEKCRMKCLGLGYNLAKSNISKNICLLFFSNISWMKNLWYFMMKVKLVFSDFSDSILKLFKIPNHVQTFSNLKNLIIMEDLRWLVSFRHTFQSVHSANDTLGSDRQIG